MICTACHFARFWLSGLLVYGGITSTAARANAFKVTPYVQNPATNAMTVMWLAREDGAARIACWPEAGGIPESPVFQDAAAPRQATELNYDGMDTTSYTTYPYLTFETPWQFRHRIGNLQPGTRYTYAVEMEGGAYTNTFRTAPSFDTSIRFVCYADSETQPESTGAKVTWEDPAVTIPANQKRKYPIDQTDGYASNIVTMLRRAPDLIIACGDLVEQASKQVDWDEFWRHNAGGLGDPGGSVAILAAPGNHEYHNYFASPGLYGERGMSKFLSYFEFPPNGAAVDADQLERFHRLDYGGVTLIFIDANNGPNDPQNAASRDTNYYLQQSTCRAPDFNPGTPQHTWITNQLADAQQKSRFTFVVSHQCPFSVGYHGRVMGEKGTEASGEELSGAATRVLTNEFFRYGVDAWFSGHDEIYEHSRVSGSEVLPDGTTVPHAIEIYDIGIAGDGLRGMQRTTNPNPHEVFRAHADAPEVYDGNGILTDGGKHYGHLEVNVATNASGAWSATFTPVYVFVTTNTQGQAVGFERRVYDDETTITLPTGAGGGARADGTSVMVW